MSGEKKPIDWEQVRHRLAASQAALGVSPAQLEAVYRERAARLARARAVAAPRATLRVLMFLVGRARFALEFADLAAVRPFAGCAAVPGGPPALLGVVNIDGDIRSVLDLGRLLDLPADDESPPGYILVVRRGGRQSAWRVDAVEQMQEIAPDELMDAGGEAGGPARWLRGWTKERLPLLDTDALLAQSLMQSSGA